MWYINIGIAVLIIGVVILATPFIVWGVGTYVDYVLDWLNRR